jgi:hypothetical protein
MTADLLDTHLPALDMISFTYMRSEADLTLYVSTQTALTAA